MTFDMNNLTPEMKRAIVDQLVKDAFTSKAIHLLGDNLAHGLHKLARAMQASTDVTAKWCGTAQVIAVPAIRKAAGNVAAPVVDFSGRVAAGARAGYQAATAR
jgi:hypothetical protein